MQIVRRVRAKLRPLRRWLREQRGSLAAARAEARWRRGEPHGRAHRLPAPLIVSLTSYPPRFATLSLTLKRLLSQSVAPDRVALWIAHGDMALLPADVRALEAHGLAISPCDDLRSYKKIVPALAQHQGCFIATADDDVFYPRDWLETLVEAARDNPRGDVICTRAHRIRTDRAGRPLSYPRWRFDIPRGAASARNVAIGVGGALYPPGSLPALTGQAALFSALAPSADDLWLYWMARCNGRRVRKAGPRRTLVCWPRSQDVALQHANAVAGGANDAQVAALTRRFGRAWEEDFAATPVPRAADPAQGLAACDMFDGRRAAL